METLMHAKWQQCKQHNITAQQERFDLKIMTKKKN